MTTLVRPATCDDAAALSQLRWEFRAGRKTPAESQADFVLRCTAWMRAALAGASWRAWVAERDGRIVGQVWLYSIPKVPNPVGDRERHAYVSNVYVVPDARGGVGTRLLEAAIRECESMGVDRVLLQPSPRSVPLYTRHGFVGNGSFLELTLTRADR